MQPRSQAREKALGTRLSEVGHLFLLETPLNVYEIGFIIPIPYQFVESGKYETLCVSRNSLVTRRVSLGRKVVVSQLKKYAVVLRQVKPRVLGFSITRSQSNLSIVFLFVCCEQKDLYCAVSAGQLGSARYASTATTCKEWNEDRQPHSQGFSLS